MFFAPSSSSLSLSIPHTHSIIFSTLSLLSSPESTPVGRLIQRFSKDLDQIDLQVWILERREREQKGYRRKDNIVSVTVGDRERVCVGGNREREGQGVKKR